MRRLSGLALALNPFGVHFRSLTKPLFAPSPIPTIKFRVFRESLGVYSTTLAATQSQPWPPFREYIQFIHHTMLLV